MKITKTLFATGLVGLMAAAVNAQSIPDIGGIQFENSADLILGFTNPSVTTEMLVDVGPASYYYSTTNALAGENTTQGGGALTPGTYSVGAFNSSTFTGVFGANAYTSSTQWGVVGGNGNDGGPGSEANKTLWLTGTGLTSIAQSQQSGLSINLDTMANLSPGQTQVGGGTSDAVTEAKTNATSFTQLAGPTGSFNFNQGAILGTTAGAASGTTSLELYELLPSDANSSGGPATVDLGFFTLSSSGLTFTVTGSAIPEPSTYAAILGVLTVGFVLIRRRIRSTGLGALA